MKILQIIDNIIERASVLGLVISGFLILIMSLFTTYGVFRRYLLNNPEPYSYEISTSLLLACVVLAIAGIHRKEQHLRADFLYLRFSQGTQNIIKNIVGPLVALFYIGIITWQSWNAAVYSFKIYETSQSAWEEPLYPTKFIVPIGMAILNLVLLAQLGHGVSSLIKRIRKAR